MDEDAEVARSVAIGEKILALLDDSHPATALTAVQYATAVLLQTTGVPTALFAERVERTRYTIIRSGLVMVDAKAGEA